MNEQSECLNCANGEVDVTVEAHKMYLDQADSLKGMSDDNQKAYLVKWLNDMLPYLCLPSEASDEQLRTCLIDGSALCNILNKLKPSSIEVGCTSESHIVNVERFLAAVRQMGFPGFDLSNLEQGSMKPVLQCLWTLRAHFLVSSEGESIQYHPRKRWNLAEVEFPEDRQCATLYRVPSPGCIDNLGEKFETFQLKQDDASDANISELMKSDNLDIVSTQSLFSIVNKILDESIERKNGGVPHPVACLLRKVVRVIEQRVAAQAVHFRKQQNKFKAREEKYQSRIGVLETLMTGTAEETGVVMNQLQRIKIEKAEIEEKRKLDQKDLSRLMEEKEKRDTEVLTLNQELKMTKKTYENQCTKFEKQSKEIRAELEKKLAELECLLTDSRKTVKELKAFSESKIQRWRLKELTYQGFINSQYGALQELRVASDSIKEEVFKAQKGYSEEFKHLVGKLKGVTDAAQNYHTVLAENRKLYNEVQDLKGNIRVYCRIRPFLPGQNTKQTTIQYIGENGDLVTVNPLKPGKDSHRLFKFNKVFGPAATQEDVFFDTQPLIRSVLDGFNVCIFAYGQTGSGKTYTMSGPSISLKDGWGVNYRALNDLFHLSQSRSCIQYEVGVQMVEIYNEQVRDLLLNDGSQKRLGIWSTTQPNGLAVPEASMRPVKSTTDVLELMKIGLMNRAVGATALNERSSRSHSILTVHVRGTDLETSAVLRGNLHLVDLAGSERVDRSEATGDRLKEAQHINKSLSALGDVIFALAHKSGHVPYRNSKLTQVLHSSLGGQAKTLMFVQLNPDAESYSETISTLKFAERVSGVELGAARSNKEGRSLRELMDQVASLKEIIAKKDEEIERVRLLKVNSNGDKRGITSLRYGSSSPRRHSTGTPRQSQRLPEGKRPEPLERSASELGNCSIYSDKQSEAGSHQSAGDYSNHKEPSPQSKDVRGDVSQNFIEDVELLGFGDGDSDERLSDISDSVLSMGTETDGSISSMVELALFPEGTKPPEITEKSNVPCKLSKPPPQKPPQTKTPRLSSNQSSSKLLSSVKKTTLGCSSSSTTKSSLKRWQ